MFEAPISFAMGATFFLWLNGMSAAWSRPPGLASEPRLVRVKDLSLRLYWRGVFHASLRARLR